MGNRESIPGPALLLNEIERRGMTRTDAADELGVNKSSVSVWIAGTDTPNAHWRDMLEAWSGGRIPSHSWRSKSEQKAIDAARRLSRTA
jgi:hypothetical protein